ncbi:exodeoxyribonuclease III [Helicobacter valdiviensis]|uniref:Exodeoxyribonuclease III n=1 Tax=Helicobacter valdiviensis TaxID=1458358 RepID=A0A2W6MXM8_9HELI|nr:exodeoxyribonuclease III [Helicobacter valdiviensis]PZT49132.1 exodeoxyribonuclease III [Helicobacter valdiviensis]
MKLISWNVNGLRACMNKGFMSFFKEVDADIFCIQESKMQKDQADFYFEGYHEFWNSAEKKGYSGVVIFSKNQPLSVTYDMGIEHHDKEGRIICAEFKEFYLVNVYTPNSKRELERLEYRMEWEDDFRSYLKNLEKTKPVIVCGDLNVAHKEIDLKNPKTNRRNAGFTDEEREKMSILLESGFVDTFRHFYPTLEGAYSWWSYMGKARANNIGWRIDYFLCSEILRSKLIDAKIYPEILGSDHCPVGLEIHAE